MRFLHLSDLHLGKRLCEYSLIEEQADILKQIIFVADEEKPDGVLICGDVYDKSVPSAEAVSLFDGFLVELAKRHLQVFIISGNHDSPERIAFGGRIMDGCGIHLSPVYGGEVSPVVLNDSYGEVGVYMLPFVKPSHVRAFFEGEEINSYTDAVSVAVNAMNVNRGRRNVLLTHQFVTGSTRSDSEESVGGTDNVDASVFEAFDYVALGHLHTAQNCSSERIRYCGTPLKYSFAEARDTKSVTVVELLEKGKLSVRTVELKPLRDMSDLKGTFEELTSPLFYNGSPALENLVRVTLTDENDVPDAMNRLRKIYKRVLNLRYDNSRTRAEAMLIDGEDCEKKTAFELFEEFFEKQNNRPLTEEERAFVAKIIERIEEDDA